MSDAPQQPQLRLKPRSKNEANPSQPQTASALPAPPPSGEETTAQPQAAALSFKLRSPTPPPTADAPTTPAASAPSPLPPPPSPPPSEPAPISEETPPPGTQQPPSADAAPRLKLRTKDGTAAPAAAVTTPPPPAPASPQSPAEESNAEAGSSAGEASPRKTFKLSAKPPATPHPHPEGVPPAFVVETQNTVEAPTPPEPPRQAPEPITTAPFPEGSPATVAPSPSLTAPGVPKTTKAPPPFNKPSPSTPPPQPRPKVPHFKPSEKLNLPSNGIPGIDAPPVKKGEKRQKLLGTVLLVCVVGIGGYLAYQNFFKPAPPPVSPPPVQKPAPVATPVTPPPATQAPATTATIPPTPPPPSTEDTSLAHVPAKLIAKAQDSLAARRNIEQERIDNPGDGKDTPAQRGFPLSPSDGTATRPDDADSDKAHSTSYSNIAPGIAATDSSIKISGKPGTSFRRVVSDLTIRGVFQGSPARAHINGRIIVAGSLVDKDLGIIFVGVNADDKMLVFRDASGATVMRRY